MMNVLMYVNVDTALGYISHEHAERHTLHSSSGRVGWCRVILILQLSSSLLYGRSLFTKVSHHTLHDDHLTKELLGCDIYQT